MSQFDLFNTSVMQWFVLFPNITPRKFQNDRVDMNNALFDFHIKMVGQKFDFSSSSSNIFGSFLYTFERVLNRSISRFIPQKFRAHLRTFDLQVLGKVLS